MKVMKRITALVLSVLMILGSTREMVYAAEDVSLEEAYVEAEEINEEAELAEIQELIEELTEESCEETEIEETINEEETVSESSEEVTYTEEETEEETTCEETSEEETSQEENSIEETEADEETSAEEIIEETVEESEEAEDITEEAADVSIFYSIAFSANGGTGTMDDLQMEVGVSSVLTKNSFKRTGYSFKGWNTAQNGSGTAYANCAEVNNLTWNEGQVITLYAQWAAKTYSISYELDGGNNSSDNPVSYKITTSTITLAAPTRKGYTFKGWYTNSSMTSSITKIVTGSAGNITLYAKWSANKYYVKYEANGGTLPAIKTMSNTGAKYNTTYNFRTNVYTRSGYKFLGWSKSSTALEATYTDGQTFKNLSSTNGAIITLYAVWIKVPTTVLKAGTTSTSATKRTSKKGIQVGSAYEAESYNVENIMFNIDVANVITTDSSTGVKLYSYDGVTYYLNTYYLYSIANSICYFRDQGGKTVTAALYCTQIIPSLTYSKNTGATFYALNTWSSTPKSHVQTVLSKMSTYIGTYIDNWIVGNEIDCSHVYNEMGDVSVSTYAKNYTTLLRMVYNTMKKKNSTVCTLVPFDQGWTHTSELHFSSKTLLAKIAALTAEDDFNWGIALHPYGVNLKDTNWWDDDKTYYYAIQHNENTDMYTMCNIETITRYLASHYKYNGTRRKICITEFGVAVTADGKKNEKLQAAGIAYAYYKAEADPNIDLFIYNAMSDNWGPDYTFGLKDINMNERLSYTMFVFMDTTLGRVYTTKYISKLGTSSWKALVPGLDYSKFERMATLKPYLYNESYLQLCYHGVRLNYNGVVYYRSKYYYCTNGFVDKSYSGTVIIDGGRYKVVNGVIKGL